jgi:hypothetical protein
LVGFLVVAVVQEVGVFAIARNKAGVPLEPFHSILRKDEESVASMSMDPSRNKE